MDCPVCGNDIGVNLVTCPFCQSPVARQSTIKRRFQQRTVNLEDGKPTVEIALSRLKEVVDDSLRRNICVLTLIHGYGSSGKGWRIRLEVRKMLDYMAERGIVAEYISGESFNKRNGRVKNLLQRYPQLVADKNLGRANKGITVVVLSS